MKRKRILVVDDERAFTRLVKLNFPEYEVIEENHAALALQTARRYLPDLILLDVVMPEEDGGQLAGEMRSDWEVGHIPIVFVTAIVSRAEAGKDQFIGGFPFLAKPVLRSELNQCVRSYLDR